MAALIEHVNQWVAQNVGTIYLDGVRQAGGDVSSISPEQHQYAQVAAEDLASELARAARGMADDAKRELRAIARRHLERSLFIGGSLYPDARKFADEMRRRGIKFVDRSGREWDPQSYAEMVLLTHSAEILNAGHLNTAAEMGSPGVRVHDGRNASSDEACRRADGQVWSLAYAMANKIEHPRCVRSFSSLPSGYNGPMDRGDALLGGSSGGSGGGGGSGGALAGGSGGGGPDPDELIRRAFAGGDLSEEEKRHIAEHASERGFDPEGVERLGGRATSYLRRQGEDARGSERRPPAEVHYFRHAGFRQEWPEGTTLQNYLQSIREVLTDPDTGIFLSRRARFAFTGLGPHDGRLSRGDRALSRRRKALRDAGGNLPHSQERVEECTADNRAA